MAPRTRRQTQAENEPRQLPNNEAESVAALAARLKAMEEAFQKQQQQIKQQQDLINRLQSELSQKEPQPTSRAEARRKARQQETEPAVQPPPRSRKDRRTQKTAEPTLEPLEPTLTAKEKRDLAYRERLIAEENARIERERALNEKRERTQKKRQKRKDRQNELRRQEEEKRRRDEEEDELLRELTEEQKIFADPDREREPIGGPGRAPYWIDKFALGQIAGSSVLMNYEHSTIEKFYSAQLIDLYLKKMKELFNHTDRMRCSLSIVALLRNRSSGEEWEPFIQTVNMTLDDDSDEELMKLFTDSAEEVAVRIAELEIPPQGGSEWELLELFDFTLHTHRVRIHRGSGWIAAPEWLSDKKCIRDPQPRPNDKVDMDQCFKYAMIIGRVYQNYEKTQKLRFNDFMRVYEKDPELHLDFTGLHFPVSEDQFHIFEEKNQIRINAFCATDNPKAPARQFYRSPYRFEEHLPLFLIENEENSHYAFITNVRRLINNGSSQNDHLCKWCFRSYTRDHKAAKCCAEKTRGDEAVQTFTMPKEGERFRFKNIPLCNVHPFVVYCDFEAMIIDNVHIVISYVLRLVCRVDPEYNQTKKYLGPDAIIKLFEDLDEINRIYTKARQNYPTIKTAKWRDKQQKRDYLNATECYLCNRPFTANRFKVPDHCPITSYIRGALCNPCNINYRLSPEIPVLFHNFSGYDSKLIIQQLHKLSQRKLSVLGSKSSLIALKIDNFRFKDSYKIIPAGLDHIVKSISPNHFKLTRDRLPQELFELVLRKIPYPYTFAKSFDDYEHTELPPIEAFRDDLRGVDCPPEDYELAKRIWTLGKCETFKDFTLLYNEIDVLLLADAFEYFRRLNLKHFKIDPANCFSRSGCSLENALRFAKIDVELLRDQDMYDFFNIQGQRGGYVGVGLRHAKAFNKYLPNWEEMKGKVPPTFIIALDITSSYGAAMCELLPDGNFEWIDPTTFNLAKITELDGPFGWWLEVDVKYPEELHNSHNDLPFLPEKMKILASMLSPDNKRFTEDFKTLPLGEALVANLYDKKRYVLHYKHLALAMKHGLQVEKVHRVLQFTQSRYLEPYVKHCMEQRKKAAPKSFLSDYWKLNINSVFGKLIEDVRKHCNYYFATNEKQALKHGSNNNYVSHTIFNEDLVGYECRKENIILNKPVFAGDTVLEYGKIYIYETFYFLKGIYGDKVRLMYTDTDSLVLYIQTEDFFEDMVPYKERFDFSSLPKNHPAYNTENYMKQGSVKYDVPAGENGEIVYISEFFAFCAKRTHTVYSNGSTQNKLAGVKQSEAAKITTNDFEQAFTGGKTKEVKSKFIRADRKAQLKTVEVSTQTLSCVDVKRYVVKNGSDSIAYGHFAIPPS